MTKHLLSAMAIMAISMTATAAEPINLPLDNLNCWGTTTYDAATKTITFAEQWSGAGWWLDSDYSAYDEVVIEVVPTDIKTQIFVQYQDAAGENQNETLALEAGESKLVYTLNPELKSHVLQIAIQNWAPGTLTLVSATIDNATPFNPDANVVLYEGAAPIVEWSWDEGKSYSLPVAKLIENKVVEGDALAFTYTTEAEWASAQYTLVHSDWTNEPFPGVAGIEGYSAEWNTVGFATGTATQVMPLEAVSINAIYDANSMKMLITGADATLTKIEIVRKGAAVNTISIENAPVEYYNLQGVRVAEPAAGQLVICRQGNKAVKMIAK